MKMKNYTKIPNDLFEESQLSINARYLFCVLKKYCGKKDFCFPSEKTLARIMGYSERYIRKFIKELVVVGIIFIKRKGFNRPNTYKVSKDLIRNIDSSMDRKTESYHIGTPVPLYTGTIIPPKSTYIKEKDKIDEKISEEFERCRKSLIKKGFNLQNKSTNNYKIIPKNSEKYE